MKDLENYQSHCRHYYEEFLKNPLFVNNPFEKSLEWFDEFLYRPEINVNFGFVDACKNFFRLVTVHPFVLNEYNGREFKQIPLYNERRNVSFMLIKESDFRCDVYVSRGYKKEGEPVISSKNKITTSSVYKELKKITLLDDQRGNIIEEGQEYLLSYYIEGIDNYGGDRNAYRFYTYPKDEKDRLQFYRRHMLATRIFLLRYILKCPRIFAPYWKDPLGSLCLCEEYCNHAEELFNKEYRGTIERLLYETIKTLGTVEYVDNDIVP